MPSLQSLSLHCKLVNYIDHPKHTWLANVQAKNLQELELVCYNAREWSEVDLRFLHSPGMRNLKALKMNGMRISSMEMISVIWQLMDEPSRMIDTFAYDGSTIANWIVRNRNIKNLVSLKDDFPASLDNSNLTQALSQRTGTQLELLYAQDINTWLSKQDRSPYLNLSSVGTISIVTTDPKVVLNRAAPLMFLKRLKLIEFSLDPKLKLLDPSWSDDILPHLEAKHPSLVQVYCLVRDLPDPNEYYPPLVVLWERLGGEWRGRKAPFLTYWQIATGASYASD
ncbi:hypothetical protein FRC17_003186 [Serendipita sp. 399]|nr:hypothetical protein FRC17_003186 [Serendipita sp. 399]